MQIQISFWYHFPFCMKDILSHFFQVPDVLGKQMFLYLIVSTYLSQSSLVLFLHCPNCCRAHPINFYQDYKLGLPYHGQWLNSLLSSLDHNCYLSWVPRSLTLHMLFRCQGFEGTVYADFEGFPTWKFLPSWQQCCPIPQPNKTDTFCFRSVPVNQ